ncbi:MAG TPA: hypothetical protein GX527_11570 [Clostridiaceae bacterium]|jgi:hypothetical protein|nr:hypothetical protein [Clostridiaceae bacterium]
MKGKMNTLMKIGLLIYVIYSLVDRFIVGIPNIIAIPVMILGLVMIIIGFIKTPKDNTTK